MSKVNMYALGTSITTVGAWGINKCAVAICADGVKRKTCYMAAGADTYFSVPAAVRVKGKYVRGYITTSDKQSAANPEGQVVVEFVHYRDGKWAGLLNPQVVGAGD